MAEGDQRCARTGTAVSELDLGLKVAARRVLWRMGYTTRVDVALRSISTDSKGAGRRTEAFTDLDVLGITIGPGFRVQSAIVDCKTSTRGSSERMFWVRGVADFFAADSAYMIREREMRPPARQLAARLGITAMTSDDLIRLEEYHPTSIPLESEPLAWLFDRGRVSHGLSAFGGLDKGLRPLAEYRQFDYWIYDEHRNPLQLVEHLRSAARLLDSRNPLHLGLVLDLAWLYLLSIAHAVQYVRTAQVSQPDVALQEYLLGGPLGVREKRELSVLLSELQSAGAVPANVDVAPLPSYFPALLELTTRVLRRPNAVVAALRHLEVAAAATIAGSRASLRSPLGDLYDEIAAKQAADVVGFLVVSADLHRDFRSRARLILLDERPDGRDQRGTGPAAEPQPALPLEADPQ